MAQLYFTLLLVGLISVQINCFRLAKLGPYMQSGSESQIFLCPQGMFKTPALVTVKGTAVPISSLQPKVQQQQSSLVQSVEPIFLQQPKYCCSRCNKQVSSPSIPISIEETWY